MHILTNMNNKMKLLAYLYITFQLIVCLFEIIKMNIIKFPNYAKDYDYEKCYHFYFTFIRKKLKEIFKQYIIIFLISYNFKLDKKTQDTQKNENTLNFIIEEIKTIFYENRLLIATYLSYSFKSPFDNLKSGILFFPFIFYVLQYFLYSKFKYCSVFIRYLLYLGFKIFLDFYTSKNDRYEKIIASCDKSNLKKFSLDFLKEVKRYNYNICAYNRPNDNPRIYFFLFKNNIIVYLYGKFFNYFTKNEIDSLLYLEFSRILKQNLTDNILPYVKDIIVMLFEIFLMYNENNIFKNNDFLQENYFKIYLYLKSTLDVFLQFLITLYIKLSEYEHLKFSYKKNGDFSLIMALIKFYKANNIFPIRSYLFDIMFCRYPFLDRKIEYLKKISSK